MKKLILIIVFIFSSFLLNKTYAQGPHCYSKKIKIKKVKKKRTGNLVGVKGIDDRKNLKKKFKEREKERKRNKKEEEKEIPEEELNNEVPIEEEN